MKSKKGEGRKKEKIKGKRRIPMLAMENSKHRIFLTHTKDSTSFSGGPSRRIGKLKIERFQYQ